MFIFLKLPDLCERSVSTVVVHNPVVQDFQLIITGQLSCLTFSPKSKYNNLQDKNDNVNLVQNNGIIS